MSGETIPDDYKVELPLEVGVAIVEHCLYQFQAGQPLPDPENPDAVLDVAHTIMNHTDMFPDDLAEYIPQVRELLTDVNQVLNRANKR